MFLRFAVAFLEYSENLHLIRGGKKKGSLKIKNTSPKLSILFFFSPRQVAVVKSSPAEVLKIQQLGESVAFITDTMT